MRLSNEPSSALMEGCHVPRCLGRRNATSLGARFGRRHQRPPGHAWDSSGWTLPFFFAPLPTAVARLPRRTAIGAGPFLVNAPERSQQNSGQAGRILENQRVIWNGATRDGANVLTLPTLRSRGSRALLGPRPSAALLTKSFQFVMAETRALGWVLTMPTPSPGNDRRRLRARPYRTAGLVNGCPADRPEKGGEVWDPPPRRIVLAQGPEVSSA